jgi:hypothetical protein
MYFKIKVYVALETETSGKVKVLFICSNRVIPDFSKKQFTQSYACMGNYSIQLCCNLSEIWMLLSLYEKSANII